MGVKYTYDYVKSFIEDNSGCKLISDTYNNSKSKLSLECECGRAFNVSFYHFKTKKM